MSSTSRISRCAARDLLCLQLFNMYLRAELEHNYFWHRVSSCINFRTGRSSHLRDSMMFFCIDRSGFSVPFSIGSDWVAKVCDLPEALAMPVGCRNEDRR